MPHDPETCANRIVGCYSEPHLCEVLLRSGPRRALVLARVDRRGQIHEQPGVSGCYWRREGLDDQLQTHVPVEQWLLL